MSIDTQFDAAFANDIARLESYNKHLYRPNTYLHKWWARRCGSTFRVILKHLVENREQRDYYAPGGLEGKIILDPMMGGGTTLHEAIRLGASVIGADIDPIPVLQARATLSDIPLIDLEAAFDKLYHALRAELAPFFVTSCPNCKQSTETRFTLYGLRRTCECGPALFVDSTILRYESDGSVVRICPRCHLIRHDDEVCRCSEMPEAKPPIVEKGTKDCTTCGATFRDDYGVPFYARYVPLVIVGQCPQHGLFYTSPSLTDLSHIERADAKRSGLGFSPGDFVVKPGPKSADLVRRGITTYLDLFSSRQLLYLSQAIAVLPSFNPLVRLNLALLVSTSLGIQFNALWIQGRTQTSPRSDSSHLFPSRLLVSIHCAGE